MHKYKNTNITLQIFLLFSIIFVFQSCGIFKHHKKIKNEENQELKNTLKSIKLNELKFNTFYSTFSGKFENNDNKVPLKGILKIKRDTFILISVRPFMGIEIAKILLTPDSIKIIDKIKKQYIATDYNYIKNKFSHDLDFRIIQSILINKYFEYPKNKKISDYTMTLMMQKNNPEKYFDFTNIFEFNRKKAKHSLIFTQNNFKLVTNNFSTFDNLININISYSEFNEIENSKFPKKIEIKLSENKIKNNILITYKNILINKRLNSNFVIPNNYKKAKFE